MTRLEYFSSYREHVILKKSYLKLTEDERKICFYFICENDNDDINQFAFKLNRMHLSGEKTKHWKEIEELLSCANSAAWGKK